MPKPEGVPNLRDVEIAQIVTAIKKRLHRVQSKEIGMMQCYELAGEEVGFDARTCQRVWRMMQPTTGLAADYIKARAFRMVRRVVKDASVPDLIDILSRPNIGVLDPIKKQESGGGGFILSVSAESCGAVSIGIAQNPQQILPSAPPALPEPAIDVQMVEEEPANLLTSVKNRQQRDEEMDPDARHRPRAPGNSKQYEEAVEAARKRLEERRIRSEKRARRIAKSSVSSGA